MNESRDPASGRTTRSALPEHGDAAQPKTPFVRIAELEIDPAQLEAFKAAITEGVRASVREEPGVFALYAVAERDRPTHLRVFEIYADEQAYELHRQSPHFRKFFESTQAMVLSRVLIDTVPVVLSAKSPAVSY